MVYTKTETTSDKHLRKGDIIRHIDGVWVVEEILLKKHDDSSRHPTLCFQFRNQTTGERRLVKHSGLAQFFGGGNGRQ